MQNVTPAHLASVTRAALEATELHRRNIGIYGSVGDNLDKYGRAMPRAVSLNIGEQWKKPSGSSRNVATVSWRLKFSNC